ncbi:MAG: class I SAM-dependent rRNA methyltransferase, partial [Elusimicrobiota bacterium]|nr:class I SAM-dependent rRNA methyltransferase [Elusimicrobiota bacterium]
MKKIILKAGEGKRIKKGHKWVFSNEIKRFETLAISDIDDNKSQHLAHLYDNNDEFIGKGFYNPHSLIAFRLISVKDENFDIAFWTNRIKAAYDFRKKIYPKEKSYRVVFGESDDMSGVIIDKYEDYLCAQFICSGAEAFKEDILNAAKLVFEPKGIIIRNDGNLRKLENLNPENEIFFGENSDNIIIEENGLKFYVDLINGQKTGFFFDQRDNRKKLADYAKDKKVLDCYCHTGAFGIYAKKAGAAEIVFVDSSRPALETAEKNFSLNNFDNFNGIVADALQYMESPEAKKEGFDIINIDPPGLIKSKKDFNAGFKHYVKVVSSALALLKSGG